MIDGPSCILSRTRATRRFHVSRIRPAARDRDQPAGAGSRLAARARGPGRGHRQARDARDLGRDPRGRGGVPVAPVPHDRDALDRGRGRDLRLLLREPRRREHRRDGRGHVLEGHALVPDRSLLLRHCRIHRHVCLDPGQYPHGGGGDDEPQPRAADRAARRRRLRARGRGDEPARRGRPVLAVRRDAGLQARPAADRRLRLRRELRRALRAARRRHLHEGRGRRRGPRRQGRGGNPGGRPAQPRGDRGPRGRQRGRLCRPRRRPLRIDGGRERRRDDPRHRALPGVRDGRHPVPAARARLRPDRDGDRRLQRQGERGRGPDERPEPRLPGHDRARHDRLRRGGLPAAAAGRRARPPSRTRATCSARASSGS